MKQIYLFLWIFLAVACSLNDVVEEPAMKPERFLATKTEVVASLKEYRISQPLGLVKQGGRVFVSDRFSYNNVIAIDLTSKDKEGIFPKTRTYGKNAVVMNTLTSDGKGGWTAFDFQNGRLFDSSPATRSGEGTPIQLPGDKKHLWAVRAGDYVVATGIYEEGRYLLFSPQTGQADYFLSYPEHPKYPNIKEETKAMLYASNVLRVRPDNRAFVCADMYSGMMEICRIANGRIDRISRFTLNYPKVKIKEKGKRKGVAYYLDSHMGFTDVAVTQDAIYAIYSYRTMGKYPVNFQHCHTLLVYNWDGQLIKSYGLTAGFTHLSYDTDERTLYGIAYTPDPTLMRLTLHP